MIPNYKFYIQLFHNTGVGLIAILIPFIIATFQEFLRKESNSNVNYHMIDKNIYMKKILQNGYFIIWILLIFIPSFFLKYISFYVILILFIFGVIYLLKLFVEMFRWVKGNRNDFRKKYIRKQKNKEEIAYFFTYLWKIDNIEYEEEFLRIMIDKFKNLSKKDNFNEINVIYINFILNLKKRNLLYFVISEFLPYIIDLHADIFKKIDTGKKSEYYIFNDYFLLLLNNSFSNSLFKDIHTFNLYLSTLSQKLEGKNSEFVKIILNNFWIKFYSSIDQKIITSNNILNIEIPKSFIVNPENIKNPQNKLFALETFITFYNYSVSNISFSNDEKNNWEFQILFDTVTDCFDAHSLLIHFYITKFFQITDSVMEKLLKIEHFPPTGGIIKKCGEKFPYQQVYNYDKIKEERINYTIDLIKFVKSNSQRNNIFTIFKKENYQKWLKELKEIKNDDLDEKRIKRKERLINYFKDFIKYSKI